MTAQLPELPSKERLQQYIRNPLEYGLTRSEVMELARGMLVGMEQEPVATVFKSGDSAKVIMIGADLADGYTDLFAQAATVVSEQSAYKAAVATLEHLGYTYHGGEMWKPPLGPAPNFSLIDQLHAEIDALKEQLGSYPAQIVDSDKILSDICDLFKIGELARTRSAIMTNIENAINFAEKLHAIELEFFMVPGEPDDDYPDEEPMDECLVNSWGSTTEQYVEQFRMALKKIAPPAPVAVPAPVVLPDDELINRKAFERFANNLGYSDASYFTTDTHPNYYDDDRINKWFDFGRWVWKSEL